MHVLCIALLATSLLATSLLGVGCSKGLEESFDTPGDGVLEVVVDLGEGLRPDPGVVEIASHDSNEVRVRVDASGWGAYGVKLAVDHGEHSVRVDARVQGVATWLFGGPHLALQIRIPRKYDVDLRTTGGVVHLEEIGGAVRARADDSPIRVRGAEGPLKLRTAGDVSLEDVSGEVDVRVRGGSIEVAWAEGDLQLRTSSGRIELNHVTGRVLARSGGGRIEMRDVTGPVEAKTEKGAVFASFLAAPEGSLETQRGTIEVRLPEESGAELDASTLDGELSFGEGFSVAGEHNGSRAQGRLNGGGPLLRLRSVRGDIQIRRR